MIVALTYSRFSDSNAYLRANYSNFFIEFIRVVSLCSIISRCPIDLRLNFQNIIKFLTLIIQEVLRMQILFIESVKSIDYIEALESIVPMVVNARDSKNREWRKLSPRAKRLFEILRRRHDDPSLPNIGPGQSVNEIHMFPDSEENSLSARASHLLKLLQQRHRI